ncbi:hypothetical protein GF402_08825 [Candidatus Fermentibacteria bacterium]|nr:hypothetical protein [Candidatus Fermentibacteria bacterium]
MRWTEADRWLLYVLPPLLGALAYVEVLGGYFQSDDFWHIAEVARKGVSLGWGAEHGFLRPLTGLSFLLDHAVWGLRPFGYHLTNVLLHAAACVLLAVVLRRFLTWCEYLRASGTALVAAVLFAVLPAHSEAVGWISGRTDLLAAALGLAATVFLLDLVRRPSWSKGLLFVLLASACLLSKESAAAFPVIWVILGLAGKLSRREGPDRALATVVVLSLLPLAAYLAARKLALGTFVGGYGTSMHTSLLSLDSFLNLVRYAWRSLLPPIPGSWGSLPSTLLMLGAASALAAALGTAFYKLLRGGRQPGVIVGLALLMGYVVSTLPVLSMGVSLEGPQSERLLYLPSVLAVSCVGLLAARLLRRRWALISVTGILVLAQALALVGANHRWRRASELAGRIARELGEYDPETTLVLNVPDNYRGAYVFRHGLTEAATFFQGAGRESEYQVLLRHSVNSLRDRFEFQVRNGAVRLSFPAGTELFVDGELPPGAELSGNGLYLPAPSGLSAVDRLVGFHRGLPPPVLIYEEYPVHETNIVHRPEDRR